MRILEHLRCDSNEEAYRVALMSGMMAMATQLIIYFLCVALSGSFTALKGKGGFVAHQIIAGFYMILLFVVGSSPWFLEDNLMSLDSGFDGSSQRLLQVHATSRWCCAVVVGELVLWDIPCALIVPSLQDPLMLGHHVVMAAVAYVSAFHIPSAYCLFFFGVVELSSIPLAIVDFFHPQKGLPKLLEEYSILRTVNEISRITFALLFMVVRAVYFPRIVIFHLLPDVFTVWSKVTVEKVPLIVIVVSAVGLTILQLYWALLIGKQVVKLVAGEETKKEKSK